MASQADGVIPDLNGEFERLTVLVTPPPVNVIHRQGFERRIASPQPNFRGRNIRHSHNRSISIDFSSLSPPPLSPSPKLRDFEEELGPPSRPPELREEQSGDSVKLTLMIPPAPKPNVFHIEHFERRNASPHPNFGRRKVVSHSHNRSMSADFGKFLKQQNFCDFREELRPPSRSSEWLLDNDYKQEMD